MSVARLRPPGGQPPPQHAITAAGRRLELAPLAQEICRRYRAEFPDEEARYGDAGQAWCVHDNQHILNWAVADAAGLLDLDDRVAWLAGVLAARDFPLERLARDLDIAAEVMVGEPGDESDAVAGRLRQAAWRLRADRALADRART